MQQRVKHFTLLFSMLTVFTACGNEEICDENPDLFMCGIPAADGETGETGGDPEDQYCIPFNAEDPAEGYSYACQGNGNGWLSLTIVGEGVHAPECVNWGPDGKPDEPTVDDCIPVDLTMLPNQVPSPAACCTDDAPATPIEEQCAEDCGFAACNLAIEKIRAAADALPEDGAGAIKTTAQLRAKDDLNALASNLEAPASLAYCANLVTAAAGEVVLLNLGEGMSDDLLGHVQNATLALQCSLDEMEPFVFSGESCDAPPNIPIVEHESHMGGTAALGSVTLFGPGGDANTSIFDVSFTFTETLNRDGSIDFLLTKFSAQADTTAYSSFVFTDPSVRLAASASGSLVGETVIFPPGSLRMSVSAGVTADGEVLFEGEPMSGVYINTRIATAARTADGNFSFIEAPFDTSGYLLVLNTEEGPFQTQ